MLWSSSSMKLIIYLQKKQNAKVDQAHQDLRQYIESNPRMLQFGAHPFIFIMRERRETIVQNTLFWILLNFCLFFFILALGAFTNFLYK